jgi:hypothetical protein
LLGCEAGKFDVPFFPRFFAGLGLGAADQLKQTTSSPADVKIITGSKPLRFCDKPGCVAGVENQSPFKMFLSG